MRIVYRRSLLLQALRNGPLIPFIGELDRIGVECPNSFHRVDLRGFVRQNHTDEIISGHLGSSQQFQKPATDRSHMPQRFDGEFGDLDASVRCKVDKADGLLLAFFIEPESQRRA